MLVMHHHTHMRACVLTVCSSTHTNTSCRHQPSPHTHTHASSTHTHTYTHIRSSVHTLASFMVLHTHCFLHHRHAHSRRQDYDATTESKPSGIEHIQYAQHCVHVSVFARTDHLNFCVYMHIHKHAHYLSYDAHMHVHVHLCVCKHTCTHMHGPLLTTDYLRTCRCATMTADAVQEMLMLSAGGSSRASVYIAVYVDEEECKHGQDTKATHGTKFECAHV
jgi:hypothetical protein